MHATAIYPGTQAVGVSHDDFAGYYGANRDRVVRALSATIGDTDLAADAVDEAMARAYQRWSKVAGLDNPNGWVYRVALNWSTSVLRRRRRRSSPLEPPAGSFEHPAMAEPAVAAALAELDVRQRAVVVCRYLLGWSEAETAEALNTPVGTVKSRLHRANRILSARLSHLRSEEQQ
ncbi:sigma-70 family RNA polymerase sigma factor [Acidiferrimicrobium sp. IK]|uniref:sigma-70 family RNA polymerase sigma factor n=1 Tax=Acidiferrimicrobium sp. IK TaxID=2871700 RepID=UPI0021CB280A|nr:sigma-70 family RNA polymerase sigma factor [Acidiferrimicrobium sp. IK]MCU4183302.1 sigma-70 family RNA polymerase sigma factor [Acidiferrimicrobium sp. IK]